MAIAADTEREPGIQKGRGGFYRAANDTPWVTSPDGALTKSGPRKGLPLRVPYGSPSGAGKLIENTFNLQKWGERMTVTGIGVDLALIADCAVLATMDRDTDEWREAADRVVVAAKNAAKSNLSAERGTHAHSHTEDVDTSAEGLAAAILAERIDEGVRLGIAPDVQQSLRTAWAAMLAANGLEVLAVEASVVDDAWRLAGTLDRIVRLTRDLHFVNVDGEVVVIPAGTVLVLDVKSGKRKTARDGTIMYWHGYAVQIASYAQAVPYDVDAETRGAWPWPISQDHALIAHLDVLGAIDGNPSCTLVYVDVAAGREHGGACVQDAKAWADRRDVFSIAQLSDADSPPVSAPTEDRVPSVGNPSSATGEPSGTAATDAPSTHGKAASEQATGGGDPSVAEIVGVGAGDREVPDGPLPPVGTPAPTPADERAWVLARQRPDEGGTHPDPEFNELQQRYSLTAPLGSFECAWLGDKMREAKQALVDFHSRGNRSRRRYSIIEGLLHLLAAPGVVAADTTDDERTALLDDSVRYVIASIVGDPAWFAHIPAGALVGSLSAAEAETFAHRAHALATTTVDAVVDDAGHLWLRFEDAAGTAAPSLALVR